MQTNALAAHSNSMQQPQLFTFDSIKNAPYCSSLLRCCCLVVDTSQCQKEQVEAAAAAHERYIMYTETVLLFPSLSLSLFFGQATTQQTTKRPVSFGGWSTEWQKGRREEEGLAIMEEKKKKKKKSEEKNIWISQPRKWLPDGILLSLYRDTFCYNFSSPSRPLTQLATLTWSPGNTLLALLFNGFLFNSSFLRCCCMELLATFFSIARSSVIGPRSICKDCEPRSTNYIT
jgi:hypothetical protein